MNAVRSPAPGNCYLIIKTVVRFVVFVGIAHDLFNRFLLNFWFFFDVDLDPPFHPDVDPVPDPSFQKKA